VYKPVFQSSQITCKTETILRRTYCNAFDWKNNNFILLLNFYGAREFPENGYEIVNWKILYFYRIF
jgi:hypothetical protein